VPGGSFIRAMVADRAGTIWLAGVNELGRLVPGPEGRLVFESLRAKVPPSLGDLGAIWRVHVLPDGVWFQGDTAVLHWTGTEFETWPMDDNQTVLSYRLGDGLLVARVNGWFRPRPNGQWEELGGPELGKVLPVFVEPDPAGGWLVGTSRQGLQHFDGRKLTPQATAVDGWLKTKRPYSGRRLADGRLVVTSLQGGAVILTPDLQSVTLLDQDAGLASDTVLSTLEDRFGALWLGTDRGLARVDLASPVTWFGQPHGLGRAGPETIQRIDGQIVVGGAHGMLRLQPASGPLARPRFEPAFEGPDRFNVFHPLPDGVLTGGLTGLRWLSGGRFTLLVPPDGPLSNIKEIVEAKRHPGWFYVTHLNGLALLRRTPAGWDVRRWPEPRGEVRCPVEDGAGNVWVSTPNGEVYRLHPPATEAERPVVEHLVAGLPEPRTQVWINDGGDRPLFHTRRGFFRYDEAGRRFVPDPEFGARVLGENPDVRVMEPDGAGGLWLAIDEHDDTPARLLDVRGGRAEQLALTDREELGALNFLSREEHDGRELLWIGGASALLKVDLTAWQKRGPTPVGASCLSAVTAGNLPVDLRPGVAAPVPAKDNTVRFVFGTPGLAGEPDVEHETELRGFAGGGARLASGGERTFTNLPAGDYDFSVRGRSADGRWSAPAQFAFTVLAPWWQTAWARAGYFVLAGLLLFVYIRWRIRRLTRERRRLEAVVAERTAELALSNAELRRLHRVDQDEKLSARLAEEKARLELLRYQLNPHFLYNSLNSIRALIYSNAAAAGEMVTRLSEFCRWTLTRSAADLTTVGEEAEMLQAYLDIERTRWQDGLVATVEIDEAVRSAPLPQFLLLPLLENAIKYGGKTSPDVLEVRVRAWREDGQLVCEVANTGTWVELNGETSRESTRIGLENLRERLHRHYGPACDLERGGADGWVRMRLRLPLAGAPAQARASEVI
jgi:hypothetical protein